MQLCRLPVRMREYIVSKAGSSRPGWPGPEGEKAARWTVRIMKEAYEKADIDEEYPDDRRRRIPRQGHDE
jgi:hypothetical protein